MTSEKGSVLLRADIFREIVMFNQTVRVSKRGRDQLITLKRRTGIGNWNILCRWALCTSLSETKRPRKTMDMVDCQIEIAWHTFAGEYAEIYEALLKHRCKREGVKPTHDNIAMQLQQHIHRGISLLADRGATANIAQLVQKITTT